MQNLLINNNFSLLGGGFAAVRNDIVWKNTVGDDLSDIRPCTSKWPVMVPLFAYHRLYLVTEGSAVLKLTDNTSLILEKNKLYLIPPFLIQSVENTQSISHFYLHFRSNSRSADPFKYYRLINPVETNDSDADIFRFLLANYMVHNIKSELNAQGAFSLLLSRFFDENAVESPAIKKFSPVLEYIENNIDKKITVKQLADVLGYNEAYFSVLFSRQFKVTPLKYISEKKMLLARKRLALSNMSVKEISDELGFENEFYFNTVFRKAIGIAPGKWRKQYFRQHSGEPPEPFL